MENRVHKLKLRGIRNKLTTMGGWGELRKGTNNNISTVPVGGIVYP